MKRLMIVLCMLTLAGCVAMAKVETGDHAIGERLAVKLDGAWNYLEAPGLGPARTWTMEGLPVDQLLLYSGLKDGELVFQGLPKQIDDAQFKAIYGQEAERVSIV